MNPSSLNLALCTHVIATFMQVNGAGNIMDTQAVTSYIAKLVSWRAMQKANMKIMVAFGGAGSNDNDWSTMTANPSYRQNFATNVLNYLQTNQIDGVGRFKSMSEGCR